MDTSIKRLLEVAGVDITKGKAKELCEGKQTLSEGAQTLSSFLKKNPNINVTLDMGNNDLTTKEYKVKSAAEFSAAITDYVKVSNIRKEKGEQFFVGNDGTQYYLFIASDPDSDEDTVGEFVLK